MSVRFGVIGCGVIAYWTHLRELRRLSGARLVAASDPDATARQRATQLTGVTVYEDASELLSRPDIDAVVISAPTHLHAELGIAAARARKHFYLEKPVATNAADASRLADAVREAGVSVALGFNRRCHPLHLQARGLIDRGVLGSIRAVFSTQNEPIAPDAMPAWKRARSTGGGVLLDLASHHADLLRWFLKDEVAEVRAQIDSSATEDDGARTFIRMRSGAGVQSYFSFRAARADFLEFIGERGTLRVDRHRASLSLRLPRRFGYGMRSAFLVPDREMLAWWMARLYRRSYESSYRIALAEFVRGIRGEASRGATLIDGMRSLDVVLAAEESSRTGTPIGLSCASY